MRKTPGNHYFLVLVIVLAFLSTASAAIAEKSPSQQPSKRAPKAVRIVQLEPQADAQVVIPNLSAIVLSDGSVKLHGSGAAMPNAEPQGFDYQVDLASGTYTTRKLDKQEIAERDRVEKGSLNDQKPDSVAKAIAPGSYGIRFRVQTRDPFYILLAETMTSLVWTVSPNGAVTGTTASQDGCWAANPSALNTHWFTSYCKWGGLYGSPGRVCNDNQGNYYNWDYGAPDIETSASHWVWVCGQSDGVAYYDWSATHRGEDWPFLTGSVSSSGV